MDYDARFYADNLQGIGPYDKAAIRFGYTGMLEVFDEDRVPVASWPSWVLDNFMFLRDYHDLPKILSGRLTCNNRSDCDPDLWLAWEAYQRAVKAEQDAGTLDTEGDRDGADAKRIEANAEWDKFYESLWTFFRDATEGVEGDVEGIWDRKYISFDKLQQAHTAYSEGGSPPPDVVPYKFCSDEIAYYGYRIDCQRWDKGATHLETVRDRMERYDAYYFFSNFRRDRANFGSIGSYLGGVYGRYFSPMASMFRWAMYSENGLGTGRDNQGRPLTYADFPVGRDWQAAGLEGMNFLNQVFEQPAPGSYCLGEDSKVSLVAQADDCAGVAESYCQDDDGTFRDLSVCESGVVKTFCTTSVPVYKPLAAGDTCATGESMTVDPGIGKHYSTTWTNEYNYKPTRIGAFWDKYAALFAMTENEGFFFRDFSSYFDIGAFKLSYWSGGFQNELLDMFQGVFEGGTGRYAWRFDKDRNGADRFRPAPVVDLYVDAVDEALPRIQSSSSYSLKYWGMILPMARFNSPFDYTADFLNYSRVCLEGYVDCLDWEGFDSVDFIDPTTGYKYVASVSDKEDRSIAKRLLVDLDAFRIREYQPLKDAYGEDPSSDNLLALERAERELNRRLGFLDLTREVGAYMSDVWR
jgi:hypothetical protein